jgi:hypothetical protein
VLTAFNVPGISVAIVKDDDVVLAKGYGIKHKNITSASELGLDHMRSESC